MALLFRNRWIALLWLAMTVASASLFVTDRGGATKLLNTAAQIRAQRQQAVQPAVSLSRVTEADDNDAAMPVLLPADDLGADPLNPKPGDVFIEAVSGRRVQIVEGEASAHLVK